MHHAWDIRLELLEISHRWYLVVAAFLLGSLLGWGAAFVFPTPYRAKTELYVAYNADAIYRNPDDYKNWQLAKISVIFHAEEHWCMEEIVQLADFQGDASKVVACQQYPVRWDRVAEGMGCYGEFVERTEDLVPAFERAKNHDLPAVVCIKTDSNANLIPPLADRFMEVYEGPPAGACGE